MVRGAGCRPRHVALAWCDQPSSPAQPSPAPHKKLFIVNRQPPAEIFCPQLLRHLPVTEMSVDNQCRFNLRVLVFRDKYINITCSQLIQTNRYICITFIAQNVFHAEYSGIPKLRFAESSPPVIMDLWPQL